jgi:CheY-like chemotaxis protein
MSKIFVVGELRSFIEEQKSLLGRNNVRLFSAATAEEALELHKAEQMDLIIVDVDMPGMGGDELCVRIREDEKLGKVYFLLICSGRKADIRKAERCGANSFITRPLDFPEIADRVGRLLEMPSRRDMRVLVKITVHGTFKGAGPFFCTSRDISVSGILIETDKTLAKGDEISCSFYLPDTERVNVEGEVARVMRGERSAYSYGVRFIEPSPEVSRRILEFMATGKAEVA